MANPRKFSEKIALQKQKQAEGTAEFEKIMSEVKATRVIENTLGNADIADGNGLHRNANLSGGSGTSSGASGGGASPDANVGGGISIGGNNGAGSVNSTSGSPTAYRESRGRSVGVGPMRRPSERKQDRSPYGSAASGLILSGIPHQTQNSYLSPPIDSSWRRSNSDSALHQTLNNLVDGSFIATSVAPNAMSDLNSLHANYHQHSQHSQRSQSPNIGRSYSPQAQRRKNTLLQQQIHHEQQQQMQHQRIQIQQQQQAQQQLQQHLQNQQRIMQQQQNLLHQQQQQQYANAKYNNSNIIFKPLHEQQLSFNNTGSLPDLTSVHYTTTNQTNNNTQMNATQQQQTLSPILSSHQNNGCHDRDQTSSPFSPPSTAGGGGPPSPYRQQQNSPTSATNTPSGNVQTSPHLSFTNLSVQSPAQNTAAAFSTLPTLGAAISAGNLTDYRQPANPPSPGSSPGLLTSGPTNDIHTSAPSSPIRHCQANMNTSVTVGSSTQSHQPQMRTQNMQNSFGNMESNTSYNSLNPAFHNHFEQFHLGDNSQSPQNNYESLEFDDLGMVNHNNYHSKIIDFGDMTTSSSSSTANSSNTTRTNPTNSTSNCTNNNNLTQQQHQRNNTQQFQHHNRQQQLLNNNATSTTSVNTNTNGPSNSCRTHATGPMNNNDRQQDILSGNSSPIHCVPSPSSPLPIPISAHSPSHHHNHHHHQQQQQQQQQLSISVQTSPHHSPHHSPSPLSVSSPGLTMLPSIPSPSPHIIQQQQQNQHNHINNQRANQLHHNQTSHNNRHQQQQQQNQAHTPTTATNIPQIIFSDYSSSRDIFDSLDLDLGTIDGPGLQMLSDQNPIMIADPSIEDSFRRDLN